MTKHIRISHIFGTILGGLILTSWMPGLSVKKQRAPFQNHYFAHRGLHTRDRTIPENSMAAFRRAVSAGYGIELDVQLSRDGHVVVFHDDDLKRVCGIDAMVCDRTYAELSETRLCSSTETIPAFSEVLHLIDGRVPLIVELKSGSKNRELCRKTAEHLKAYRGPLCIESFDPGIVTWFRFHNPSILRGQLAMPAESYKFRSPLLRQMMSRTLFNFLSRPQFIAYKLGKAPKTVKLARKLGAMDIAWTSHAQSDHLGRDAVIFEFYEPPVTYDKRIS